MSKAPSKPNRDRDVERDAPSDKLTDKSYDRELAQLDVEPVKLQLWVVASYSRAATARQGRSH